MTNVVINDERRLKRTFGHKGVNVEDLLKVVMLFVVVAMDDGVTRVGVIFRIDLPEFVLRQRLGLLHREEPIHEIRVQLYALVQHAGVLLFRIGHCGDFIGQMYLVFQICD